MDSNSASADLAELPGHYIRRLQQIAVAAFLQETTMFKITPVQYAALQAVAGNPGIDQRSVARDIGFDTSTIGEVIERLEARGLVQRSVDPGDRRVRLLSVTGAGESLLDEVTPAVLQAQERILAPLDEEERREFLRMLKQLVAANNQLSRAPTGRGRQD